jgi:hypothetical protein
LYKEGFRSSRFELALLLSKTTLSRLAIGLKLYGVAARLRCKESNVFHLERPVVADMADGPL